MASLPRCAWRSNARDKILYRSGLNVSQAIEEMERELPGIEEIDHFLRFLRSADRGICR